jgi:hypothetical protein
MKDNPSKQAQSARERMDQQDAFRKLRALAGKIGDRTPTKAERAKLADLGRKARGQ